MALLQFTAELLCDFTSRILLPVFTRRRVTVVPYGAFGTSHWFIPCRRLSNGQIGLEADFAVLIALIFWVVVIGTVMLLLVEHG